MNLQLLRRPWMIVAAAAAAALIGWSFLHPEFRPDPSTIDPVVRHELAKTGFRQTQGVSAARFETVYSEQGLTENWTSEQKIIPIDWLITEKRTRRRAVGLGEETTGLYVGPLAVVRFNRTKMPIIGDLLPFQFWSSSRMSKFVVEEATQFPSAKGGKMRAAVTYEDRYAGGELVQKESRRLQCDVTNVVEATAINSALSGAAARVECREILEPNGRQVGASNPQTLSQGYVAYTHWYIPDRGWSIPLEGQSTVRVGDTDEIRRWSSKVISFDSSAQ